MNHIYGGQTIRLHILEIGPALYTIDLCDSQVKL